MKPTLCLRIASVVAAIQAVLHTIGGVFGTPDPGPATTAVQAMKLNQFLVFGNMRTYWEFYRGMGLAMSIAIAAEAIIFWQLSELARSEPVRIRPVIGTFAIAYALLGINAGVYFFIGPVITELLIVGCLGVAFVTARPHSQHAVNYLEARQS